MSAEHDHGHEQEHGHGHAQPHPHPHPHSHADAHAHAHAHVPTDFSRAFAIGIALNLGFVAIEAFYGWQVNSLALLADAAHNLSDVAGLVLAWAAAWAARRQASERYTYGWQRASILAAFINAAVLLLAVGALGLEAVQRLGAPQPTPGWTVIAVAAVGIVVNTATALLFLRGSHGDLNARGAFLHMAADALVSLGVVLGGVLMLLKGWAWVDPLLSLLIGAVIVAGTWGLFKQSLHLLFDGVPDGIALPAVQRSLLNVTGVAAVHDLHVWAMGSRHNALTAHLVLSDAGADPDAVLHAAEHALRHDFGITHSTLQLETPQAAAACGLRNAAACGQRPGTPLT